MHLLKTVFLSGLLFVSQLSHAHAFNFGFVRVPDWMDSYTIWLAIAFLVSMIGVSVTKPRGVPINQLSKVELSPITSILRIIMLVSFIVLMGMIFVGMGLRRYSEDLAFLTSFANYA